MNIDDFKENSSLYKQMRVGNERIASPRAHSHLLPVTVTHEGIKSRQVRLWEFFMVPKDSFPIVPCPPPPSTPQAAS